MLIDWRSSIGKEALKVVNKYLRRNQISGEDAKCFAQYALSNFQFVYKDIEAPKVEYLVFPCYKYY